MLCPTSSGSTEQRSKGRNRRSLLRVGLGEGKEEKDDAGASQWGENGPVFFTPASNASLLSVLIVGLGPGAGF